MVVYLYKENKKIRLTPDKREAIACDIKGLFKSYYKDLDEPKKETIKILSELYPGFNNNFDKINKIPSLYEQYKTYTSAIQRACYPSYDAIVDIEGQDLRSNNLAGTYKASLVYDWYNINLMETLDKCQEDWAIKGEAAAYICWKEEINEIKVEVPSLVVDDFGNQVITTSMETQPIETFRAVDVKRIDPHNLYLDKTMLDNWKSCRKIYRDFIPLSTILSDVSYDLTKEEKQKLKDLVYNPNGEINNLYETKIDEQTTTMGNTVEVLEFEGDYVDPNTHEVYRNMIATVIAGKYLAKFKESQKPTSSIIWAAYMKRPDTGRGQSPLRIPEILNEVQNQCADMMMISWQLQTVPTFLAPKGALPHYIDLKPGKTVEYDYDILNNQPPQQLNFTTGLRGFDFSDFFQRKMENATGINQCMQGNLDGTVRTATESAYINSGANMRMAREAHLFSHNFIYNLVRTYALFKKVYDVDNKTIKTGDGVFATVDEEVRNGNYTFIIGGSQSAVEREAETNKLFQLLGFPAFQTLMQIVDPYTASEVLKWILNRANFKAINQIEDMLNMNGQLRQIASKMGIQDQNYEGFRQDFMNYVGDNIPAITNQLYNQVSTIQPNQ